MEDIYLAVFFILIDAILGPSSLAGFSQDWGNPPLAAG